MSLSPFEFFDHHILDRLSRGNDWSQRFPKMRPVINNLVAAGMVKRVHAPGTEKNAANQLEITDKGRERLAVLNRKKNAKK
jgi:DNA-binding PadR family transcriptional regulator